MLNSRSCLKRHIDISSLLNPSRNGGGQSIASQAINDAANDVHIAKRRWRAYLSSLSRLHRAGLCVSHTKFPHVPCSLPLHHSSSRLSKGHLLILLSPLSSVQKAHRTSSAENNTPHVAIRRSSFFVYLYFGTNFRCWTHSILKQLHSKETTT